MMRTLCHLSLCGHRDIRVLGHRGRMATVNQMIIFSIPGKSKDLEDGLRLSHTVELSIQGSSTEISRVFWGQLSVIW